MKTYAAPNSIQDQAKFAAMVETIRAGGELPAILVNGESALTGSHRIAAYEAANRNADNMEEGWEDVVVGEIPTIEVSDEDCRRAALVLGYKYLSDITDYNRLCAAIAAVTSEDDVRTAAEEQIHDDRLNRSEAAEAARVKVLTDEEVSAELEQM